MAVFPKGKGKSRYLPCIATWIRYKVDLSYNKARALGPKKIALHSLLVPRMDGAINHARQAEVVMKHGYVRTILSSFSELELTFTK